MLVYHAELPNHTGTTEQDAIDYARGLVWMEVESSEQEIAHSRHIEDVDGIGVWYCYGADHYFFTDELSFLHE